MGDKGMLGAPRELGSACHSRGQEGRHLYHPWPLQDQDPCEASHQGRNQEYLWQGCEGEGEASQDRREGLRSRCAQVTDLRSSCVSSFLLAAQRLAFPWESHGAGLGSAAPMQMADMPPSNVYVPSNIAA